MSKPIWKIKKGRNDLSIKGRQVYSDHNYFEDDKDLSIHIWHDSVVITFPCKTQPLSFYPSST